MDTEKPIVSNVYLLEKYPGKGGWTYASIPEILQDKKSPFGWVKVKGSIDDHEIKSMKLMPMGNGKLFLPVKAAIRKTIGKKAGDLVKVVLFADNTPPEIPEELMDCLKEEPDLHKRFMDHTEGQQKEFVDWIYSAKTDETRVGRIAETLNRLAKHQKLRDKKF